MQLSSDLIAGIPRLAVDWAGAGELAVFLHGVGGNRGNWTKQLRFFARHFRAAACDARGYGDSDDYDGPLQFSQYADDVVRVLDFFAEETAHIIGLSMGGNVALDFAARYSNRVRSLVLCDTDRGMTHLPKHARQEFVRLRSEPLLAGKNLSDVATAIVDSLVSPNASKEAKRSLMGSMLSLRKQSYLKSVRATVDFDGRHLIAGISCPTLVIVGEFDTLTPLAEAQTICTQIAGSRLVVIPNAGHVSNIEQPDIFNKEVCDFLLNAPR